MESEHKSISYHCDCCSQVRRLYTDYTFDDNGLSSYTDTHRSSTGTLSVYNLQIDRNSNVRTVEKVSLYPVKKISNGSRLSALPVPSAPKQKNIRLSHISAQKKLRLNIYNEWTETSIKIGQIKPSEEAIATIKSEIGGYTIYYYPSAIEYTQNTEKWMKILVNVLEILPPDDVGYFVEVLKYFEEMSLGEPTFFDVNILELILTAKQITLSLGSKSLDDAKFKLKLSKDQVNLMYKIIEFTIKHPNRELIYYTTTLHDDYVYLIFLVLLMEKHDILKINRPIIIQEVNSGFIKSIINEL
ncbi:MAG: hypothetical protein INQ03_21015 [Candidatus Heimdallarchaeota archaeon]|nr:hypothetical protein [Candidatus Heimdallarchaeota archaeon]